MAESERPLLSSGSGTRSKAKPGRLRWVLALAMIAVIGGFGWVAWSAYKTGGTGIDGIVPLIKADNEPTRVRPDDPGGMPVPNQDKAIYDKLDPKRAPPKGVERLLPPPEAPVGRPAASVAPPSDATPSKPAIPTLGESVPAPERNVGTATVKAAPEPPPPTPQEQAAASAPQPFSKVELPPAPPKTAPGTTTAKAPAAQVATTTPPATAATKPAPAINGVRVQLGAVGSEDAAQKEWDRIRKANSDILGSVGPAFVRADLGDKGVVYRIQAGPLATADAAADLCSKLKTRNVGCFVSR